MDERTFTDAELDRAVAALSDPERFRAAEARVTRAAPRLQGVLDQEQQIRQAVGHESPVERADALRGLLAEEARIGMLVGVAVGWELARELELTRNDD
jgi:hypothetical protein